MGEGQSWIVSKTNILFMSLLYYGRH